MTTDDEFYCRCPACESVYLVSVDLLTGPSESVRCGNCEALFNIRSNQVVKQDDGFIPYREWDKDQAEEVPGFSSSTVSEATDVGDRTERADVSSTQPVDPVQTDRPPDQSVMVEIDADPGTGSVSQTSDVLSDSHWPADDLTASQDVLVDYLDEVDAYLNRYEGKRASPAPTIQPPIDVKDDDSPGEAEAKEIEQLLEEIVQVDATLETVNIPDPPLDEVSTDTAPILMDKEDRLDNEDRVTEQVTQLETTDNTAHRDHDLSAHRPDQRGAKSISEPVFTRPFDLVDEPEERLNPTRFTERVYRPPSLELIDEEPAALRTNPSDQSMNGSSDEDDAGQKQTNHVRGYTGHHRSSLMTLVWVFVSAGLVFLLAVQAKPLVLEKYAQHGEYRQYVAVYCRLAGCALPPRIDPSRIVVTYTKIDLHPTQPGALRFTIKMVNQASFDQPYPQLQLTLTDKAGRVVGRRTFSPELYLSSGRANRMTADSLSTVDFYLSRPHEKAVGFIVDIVTADLVK